MVGSAWWDDSASLVPGDRTVCPGHPFQAARAVWALVQLHERSSKLFSLSYNSVDSFSQNATRDSLMYEAFLEKKKSVH